MKLHKIGWRKYIVQIEWAEQKEIDKIWKVLTKTFPSFKFVVIGQ